MYCLYKRKTNNENLHFIFEKQISLLGCKSGYIPYLVSKQLSGKSEPMYWHININNSFNSINQKDQALIINLKPNSKNPNLSLYEIMDVWGYSSSGWTPIMFYLRGLFIDENPDNFNDADFRRDLNEIDDPIFSMTYLSGTIKDGNIIGKWITPRPSSTNSVLLWPDVLEYFFKEAKNVIDEKLNKIS